MLPVFILHVYLFLYIYIHIHIYILLWFYIQLHHMLYGNAKHTYMVCICIDIYVHTADVFI